jgi:hypothetical protein
MGYAQPEDPLCAVASPEELVWLGRMCEANGYLCPQPMGGGKWAALSRFAYTCAILKGDMFDDYGYEDRWCFCNFYVAGAALVEWRNRGFEGEPIGWHRHPDSGRRRPDGDPSKEYINR